MANPSDNLDSSTSNIIRQVSIAAHRYAKSKTSYLTALLKRVSAHTEVEGPSSNDQYSRDFYKESHGRPAYTSRLFFRTSDNRRYVPPFAKDYARIVHSPSFRKLQGKSQLIPNGENYFFRTRLTHSIEVADIATRIARKINHSHDYFKEDPLDYDLISSAALLHDIGHPPFGHSGEEGLNEQMVDYGGFEGNAQTLRLVTRLENRLGRDGEVQDVYNEPRGLNLTIGTLAAIIKYDKPYSGPQRNINGKLIVTKGYYPEEGDIVRAIKKRLGVEQRKLYTIECQIMDIADDIAYSAYDLEDTMEAGIVTPFDFISVEDQILEKITSDVAAEFKKRNLNFSITPGIVLEELAKVFGIILTDADAQDPYDLNIWNERAVFVGRSHNEALLHAKNHLIRRQFLETLIEGSIDAIDVDLDKDKPFMSELKVRPWFLLTIECMKAFNFHKVISSRKLQIPHYRGKHIVEGLFEALKKDKEGLLLSELERIQLAGCGGDEFKRARLISDIIAGLTDMEAIRLFNRLNGGGNTSVFEYA